MINALVPLEITADKLISSTVAEPSPTEVAWSSVTTYAANARVILAATHRKYRALQASTDQSPAIITNIGVYWVDDGPTDRWAMFDGGTSYQTSGTSPLTVVVRPGFFNGLYFAGIEGAQLDVTILSAPGGTVIHSSTTDLEASQPDNMYDFWFAPFKPATDHLITGLTPYSQAEVTMTITGSGTVRCGVFAAGDMRPMGVTQYNSTATPKSYSTIVTTNGVSSIVKRRAGNDLKLASWIKISEANNVHEDLMSLIDTPCLWLGSELANYRGLRSWGLGVGTVSYDYPDTATVSINVTGLLK